jgi:hypothetical protein
VSEPCGCDDRERHVEPYVDAVLHVRHGERGCDDDPQPWHVPGTESCLGFLDAYCLCGHPNYMTCAAWADGDIVAGLTIQNVGGYLVTTKSDHVDHPRRHGN